MIGAGGGAQRRTLAEMVMRRVIVAVIPEQDHVLRTGDPSQAGA